MIDRLPAPWRTALLASGVALTALAIASNHMWRVLPWERFALSIVLAALALLLAWPLRRFARWSQASAQLLLWSLALAWFVGVPAVLATLLLVAAAWAIGLRIVGEGPGRAALAIVVGLLVVAGVAGWIVQWPVHHRWTWALALLAIVALQWRALLQVGSALRAGWRIEVAASPRWAAAAVLLLGLASTACWLPTMQGDDLAYHLGLPNQWLAHGRYLPDPRHQVWAFAPWAGDTLHGIVAVLARGEGRGTLNASWIALGAALAWALGARLGANADERWAGVAVFASFPPLVWLAAGMQTELPAIAALTALLLVALPGLSAVRWRLIAGAVLCGGLLALKPMHGLCALPLLAYAAWAHRAQMPWRRLPLAIAIVLLLGSSAYWAAWRMTGNPVLPSFNALFQSPFFAAANFDDDRWRVGVDLLLPWHLVVQTDRYGETWPGGIGFGLTMLAGAWLLALLIPARRALTLAVTGVAALPLLLLQYARYATPGLVLLPTVLLPGMQSLLGRRGFAWMIGALCMVNLAFQANAGWTQHSVALKRVIGGGGDAALAIYTPERLLLRAIPVGDSGIVLATDPHRGYAAELAGRGRVVSWHDPMNSQRREIADSDASGAAWQGLFAANDARWLLVSASDASPALRAGIAGSGAARIAVIGNGELWAVPPDAGSTR